MFGITRPCWNRRIWMEVVETPLVERIIDVFGIVDHFGGIIHDEGFAIVEPHHHVSGEDLVALCG